VKIKTGFVEPMLSLPVAKLPEGPAWSYELKFDGYRALGLKADDRIQLLSRNKELHQALHIDRTGWKSAPTQP
jgi:ATP-dependent DNA ligase